MRGLCKLVKYMLKNTAIFFFFFELLIHLDTQKKCNASREGIVGHNLSPKKLVYPSKNQKKSGKRRESKQDL